MLALIKKLLFILLIISTAKLAAQSDMINAVILNALTTQKLDSTFLPLLRTDSGFKYSHTEMRNDDKKMMMDFFHFTAVNTIDEADSVSIIYNSKFYAFTDYKPNASYYFSRDKKALRKFNDLADLINKYASKQTIFPIRDNLIKNTYILPRTKSDISTTLSLELAEIDVNHVKVYIVSISFFE